MATFDRSKFADSSREELLDYIEQQSEQLGRFETRFRDVVRAYRGVLKEKEALEASIQALSVAGQNVVEDSESVESGAAVVEVEVISSDHEEMKPGLSDETNPQHQTDNDEEDHVDKHTDGESTVCDKSDGVEAIDTPTRSEKRGSSSKEPSPQPPPPQALSPSTSSMSVTTQLKQQLATLTVAMATLTEEKSKMEANFQTDKKAMLAQQDAVSKQLNKDKEQLKNETKRLQAMLDEAREGLRSEQSSREEEQLTHAMMLKELQTLIATERDEKEAYKLQLQESNREMERLHTQLSNNKTREYQEQVQAMSVELEQVRSRLQVTEKQASEPSPLLVKLQEEMAGMKVEHHKSLEREQQRANDAEQRLRMQAQHGEQRTASLESKLSELSEMVGKYDRQRENDQAAILKLKDRVAQLDSENTALTKAHIERNEISNSELSSQVSVLKEQVARLKALLKIATVKVNEKATLPSNFEELSVSDYVEIVSSEPSKKEYQQELYQLKEEFEKYKTRAQSVLKNRGVKESDLTNREIKELQQRNKELLTKLDSLQTQCEDEEERHVIQTQKLREEMRAVHDKHKQEMSSLEAQHKAKLHELQQHVQSTRDRTLKLLADKDTEIQQLRAEIHATNNGSDLHEHGGSMSSLPGRGALDRSISHGSVSSQKEYSFSSYHEKSGVGDSPGEQNNDVKALMNLSIWSDSTSAVQELLDQPSPAGARSGVGDHHLFHFVQEQHRRDNELSTSRKRRLELEDTIRELHEREQKNVEQTAMLKQVIRKLERDRSRETENLEYIKNIIIHYMSSDSAGREQMLVPIATVLHFSQEEIKQIKRRIAARKWMSPVK